MAEEKDWLNDDNLDEVFDEGPGIDQNVFNTFFKENYCEVEYSNVRNDFLEIAERGMEELFTDNTDFSKLTRKNFILYLRSETYCEFEAIVDETFDSINPEIADAVMDVSTTMEKEDEITEVYWETCHKLLNDFLGMLYEEKLQGDVPSDTGSAH